ncbi:hypothetical protein BASA50_004304 [Batrachochytrium salamandrivorans]|uniref:Uncharacterized protein n=1 Tax=Batrachochytrium salamandrivorans TaxID=1357716 RepID=A0ABQ8FG12_9FUNG|nr:hypothetical protein BASA50_004304 [Batrachochytrium salamandrivorans]
MTGAMPSFMQALGAVKTTLKSIPTIRSNNAALVVFAVRINMVTAAIADRMKEHTSNRQDLYGQAAAIGIGSTNTNNSIGAITTTYAANSTKPLTDTQITILTTHLTQIQDFLVDHADRAMVRQVLLHQTTAARLLQWDRIITAFGRSLGLSRTLQKHDLDQAIQADLLQLPALVKALASTPKSHMDSNQAIETIAEIDQCVLGSTAEFPVTLRPEALKTLMKIRSSLNDATSNSTDSSVERAALLVHPVIQASSEESLVIPLLSSSHCQNSQIGPAQHNSNMNIRDPSDTSTDVYIHNKVSTTGENTVSASNTVIAPCPELTSTPIERSALDLPSAKLPRMSIPWLRMRPMTVKVADTETYTSVDSPIVNSVVQKMPQTDMENQKAHVLITHRESSSVINHSRGNQSPASDSLDLHASDSLDLHESESQGCDAISGDTLHAHTVDLFNPYQLNQGFISHGNDNNRVVESASPPLSCVDVDASSNEPVKASLNTPKALQPEWGFENEQRILAQFKASSEQIYPNTHTEVVKRRRRVTWSKYSAVFINWSNAQVDSKTSDMAASVPRPKRKSKPKAKAIILTDKSADISTDKHIIDLEVTPADNKKTKLKSKLSTADSKKTKLKSKLSTADSKKTKSKSKLSTADSKKTKLKSKLSTTDPKPKKSRTKTSTSQLESSVPVSGSIDTTGLVTGPS